MASSKQEKFKATYMRGGTSKGVFFCLEDLPVSAQTAGEGRDRFLKRVIGSPDPYAKQIDGMGGATSSTSKTVIVSKSRRSDHDVDYLFGQVSIDADFVDWSGNCGNLSSAVGAFAIRNGYVSPNSLSKNGYSEVRIWQDNIKKTIISHVPMIDGEVLEVGDFELDGVTFPAAEVKLEFVDPAEGSGGSQSMFPTGNLVDTFKVPGVGELKATFINAGIPTIFLEGEQLGYDGTELQEMINGDLEALDKFEKIRAYGGVAMGLLTEVSEARDRQHTPKVAYVAPPRSYSTSSGTELDDRDYDLSVRALSMGKLHHAMMGTAAVAIGAAAAVPGTLVNIAAGGGHLGKVAFGHPSGILEVGAEITETNDGWTIKKALMSRSARVLMEGWVYVPSDFT